MGGSWKDGRRDTRSVTTVRRGMMSRRARRSENEPGADVRVQASCAPVTRTYRWGCARTRAAARCFREAWYAGPRASQLHQGRGSKRRNSGSILGRRTR